MLSKSFIAYFLYGESLITPDVLLQSFNNYVSETEREVIEKCLVVNFMTTAGCVKYLRFFKRSLSKENASQILTEVAHKEIIQRPQYVAECWKDILGYLKPSFPSVAVMEKIKSQPSSNGGKESFFKGT